MRLLSCSLLAALTLMVSHTSAAQSDQVPLDLLLDRASRFVSEFVEKFSSVVSEESYYQESSTALPTTVIPGLTGRAGAIPTGPPQAGSAKRRQLKSDFLIVRSATSNTWQPFRDVFEVDGFAVRDREERITKLFLHPSTDAQARAEQIAEESSRYNLGNLERTINNPVFALVFIEAEHRGRSRFALAKSDKRDAASIHVVEFTEEARPTLIRGRPGQPMPAHGRFWIESETGRITQSEMLITTPEIRAALTTVFRVDDRLQISVPAEMREDYDMSGSHVRGTATYGRFRRFGVSTTEELQPR